VAAFANDLVQDSVANRVKAHRKKEFDKELNHYIVDVRAKLSDWQSLHYPFNLSFCFNLLRSSRFS
jgi:hypothetical protein